MPVQGNEQSAVAKAGQVIFPNFVSFLAELVLGACIVGPALIREWNVLDALGSDSGITRRIQESFNVLSDAVSNTTYGKLVVTVLFWLIVGVGSYVLLMKAITYVSAAWRIYDEKQHDVFPRWYSGNSFFMDTLVQFFKWILRHMLALALLVFALFFGMPLAIAYAHIGIFGTIDPLYILYAVLALLFTMRLIGIALCILSKKITAWYARS
jgi:hypothetical protein